MRLLLLPLTKSTPLVCWQQLRAPAVRSQPRIDDKLVDKAATVWSNFGKSDKNWQKLIVKWGDKLLERIPIEEWGLKTIPPINTYKRLLKPAAGGHSASRQWLDPKTLLSTGVPASQVEPIQLVYPSTVYTAKQAEELLGKLAADGLKIHRKKMIWCMIGLPLTLPVAILPVIPNLPGFYLLYRLWSHWTAYTGAKHLSLLLKRKEFVSQELRAVDQTYTEGFEQINRLQVQRLERIFESPHLNNELERALRHLNTRGVNVKDLH